MKQGMRRRKKLSRKTLKVRRVQHPVPKWKLEELPRRLFREAARNLRKWRAPTCPHARNARGHAHHVVYEQHAVRLGANPHDPRNAMLVCPGCHLAHHHRVDGFVIPRSALPAKAIEYAHEVLGPAADDYLARHYG